MSEEILTPADMGFAEFVAKLISEVFDAVVTSQAEQEEKLLEIKELVSQPEELFVDNLLQDDVFLDQIDRLLKSYFPANSDKNVHAIYEGAPYKVKKGNSPESPAILEHLGLDLSESESAKKNKFTNNDVLEIYRAAARPFAQQKRQAMINAIEHGFSNIIVDSGKINAKFTFNTSVESEETEQEPAPSNGNAAKPKPKPKAKKAVLDKRIKLKDSLRKSVIDKQTFDVRSRLVSNPNLKASILKPTLAKDVKVAIKPANNRDPQASTTTANIYSEIELNFKSIR
ncbi:hypothetical protein [Kangiella aquimarina]|uniref:Uncharacterized protein n=1 Tax=Kangiella aquimarina TaxID=261965 RepID=A0ABZ0X5V8_9GAMM|nr:hypothetical protein [Kangiella aquimarina]WQG85905.1 hypothetical protein SR900_03235 [Kangiella aquimarina]